MDNMMTAWLLLLLLVPAIVVPIVLLWGFAGCSFEGAGADAILPFHAGLSEPDASDAPGFEGRCVVQRIRHDQFMVYGTGLYPVESITLRGPNVGSLTIDRIYISQPAVSGDLSNPMPNPWDSQRPDLSPDIHFPGGLTKVADIDLGDPAVVLTEVMPNGTTMRYKVLNQSNYPFNFLLDPAQDLLIAFDINPTPGQGRVRRVDLAGAEFYYRENSHQAAAPNRTPDYITVNGVHLLVQAIEI